MNKCVSCKKDIPDGSEFCPFCGTKLKRVKNAYSKLEKIIACIAAAFLCLSIFLGCSWYFSEMEIRKANSEIKKANNLIISLGNRANSLEAETDRLSKENITLTSEKNKLQSVVNQYSDQSDLFDITLDYLSRARTSNRILSVDSKIYCVKRGNSIIVNVNWKSNGSIQYMGIDDSKVANASWMGDSNVKVTGKWEGVTELYFGSNKECTKDRMSAVIICY